MKVSDLIMPILIRLHCDVQDDHCVTGKHDEAYKDEPFDVVPMTDDMRFLPLSDEVTTTCGQLALAVKLCSTVNMRDSTGLAHDDLSLVLRLVECYGLIKFDPYSGLDRKIEADASGYATKVSAGRCPGPQHLRQAFIARAGQGSEVTPERQGEQSYGSRSGR